MLTNNVRSGPRRLPAGCVGADMEEIPNREITRILSKAKHAEPVRTHVLRGDVKCVPHLCTLLAGNPQVARELATFILGYYGDLPTLSDADQMTLYIAECETQGREDALEAKWVAGRADSMEKAELIERSRLHREELTTMEGLLAVDLYGPNSRRQLHAGASL